MSELLVMAHETEAAGFAMREELEALRKEGFFDAEDIVVVTREENGEVRLHQDTNTTALGAIGGAVWGGLIGLVFMSPVVGAAIGAGAGAVAGHATDLGINDEFLRDAGQSLPLGGSAVFVLLRKGTAADMLERMQTLGHATGRVLKIPVPEDFHQRLETALKTGGTTAFTGEEIAEGATGSLARMVGPSAL
ncbi:MAG: DUF1269 domain-containing protein [Thioclava marina]|jgi:Predicted membrane protein|uniref:DUF1269 domain-containing protein n=1 Tax=Thioclava marina TaxID=1915077 RepID=A0ABX3MR59_9RHOB|nr:DUF1269 domain-containing protein [Thioclava marina]MBC7144411.1 DUF1269 domain-containing protein [Thioclava marina]OOY13910.1 hypothetical protein BMG00_09195 [Thioclava marina]